MAKIFPGEDYPLYSVHNYHCAYCFVPIVVDTGHSVSPHFRFLCKSGDWLWMQVEGTLHCKAGTSIPLFYEYKARVLRYAD